MMARRGVRQRKKEKSFRQIQSRDARPPRQRFGNIKKATKRRGGGTKGTPKGYKKEKGQHGWVGYEKNWANLVRPTLQRDDNVKRG